MKRFSLLIFLFFMMPLYLMAQTNVLYVSRTEDGGALPVGDQAIVNMLGTMGYTVQAVDQDTYRDDRELVDESVDVIVLSESISSNRAVAFSDSLPTYAKPIVSMEGLVFRDNIWGPLTQYEETGQFLKNGRGPNLPSLAHYSNTVINADHPLFEGTSIDAGETFAWATQSSEDTLPEVAYFYIDNYYANATTLAVVPGEVGQGDGYPTLVAVEPGDENDPDNPFMYRAVVWGVYSTGYTTLTEDFYTILGNAIDWVTEVPTSIKSDLLAGQALRAYPNPFRQSTTISFSTSKAADIEMRVFNQLGQEVARQNEFFTAGKGEMKFQSSGMKSGMYYYSLYADGLLAGTGKMMVQ
ncbi:Por secretion system C-terminal sorting domain-containing protein [Catalinimonas alkaloidigena]|uniref:Por secretion system C-terminal sorting domain-containing protein n=1 Tax=Catalinimonas alkaloidigena TaxID=1075417 RepID=A0A1G9QFX1_9BACT|nr:T9SS type A sorting domain-containing protein [Catalinimonas alkaloidigena]SDM09883.1 Por secretion system C-terminal sorting domain-containing protein [Catalinimonas alkaloidigena]